MYENVQENTTTTPVVLSANIAAAAQVPNSSWAGKRVCPQLRPLFLKGFQIVYTKIKCTFNCHIIN